MPLSRMPQQPHFRNATARITNTPCSCSPVEQSYFRECGERTKYPFALHIRADLSPRPPPSPLTGTSRHISGPLNVHSAFINTRHTPHTAGCNPSKRVTKPRPQQQQVQRLLSLSPPPSASFQLFAKIPVPHRHHARAARIRARRHRSYLLLLQLRVVPQTASAGHTQTDVLQQHVVARGDRDWAELQLREPGNAKEAGESRGDAELGAKVGGGCECDTRWGDRVDAVAAAGCGEGEGVESLDK